MKIRIYYEDIKYRLRDSGKVIKLIEKVIGKEKVISGDLNFIFTTDMKLLSINKEFLKHNYFTDVIAFNYDVKGMVNNEIFISYDTVKRNAHNYKISLRSEILRVMIHGVLHLCGYDDSDEEGKLEMRSKEDRWMNEFNRNK